MPTEIDYLDEVWNPVTGCSGKGCKVRDHCWARYTVEILKRHVIHGYGFACGKYPMPFDFVQFHPERLEKPLHWRKPRRVGVCFMGDLFDEQVPFEWAHKVFNMAFASKKEHQFFYLTKQPKRMLEAVTSWKFMYEEQRLPQRFYWGVSITDQDDLWMVHELLRVPGKHWVSIEPMLGPIELLESWYCPQCNSLNNQIIWPCPTCKGERFVNRPNWVVLGAESGPKRRPCPHDWMIDVVRQCWAAQVPVWVKQVDMGKHVSHNPEEWPEELRVRELGVDGVSMNKVN